MSQQHTWFYFSRPTHIAFHDLTTTIKPPKNIRSLLGLGTKFCPTPRHTNYKIDETLSRLDRDLQVKQWMIGYANNNDDNSEYNPKMYIRSKWTPPHWELQKELSKRCASFSTAVSTIFTKRKGRTNLLPYQHHLLRTLQQQSELVIVSCDKNLGPAIIERTTLIRRALDDHLLDTTTYRSITKAQADSKYNTIKKQLESFIKKYKKTFNDGERKFLRTKLKENEDPYPVFYLTMKVHKTPWKTRPIVSCSGSLLHPLGIWVDSQLQLAAVQQRSYFKNSLSLKQHLETLHIPNGARLFIADAVSMYTNIKTSHALHNIRRYLLQKRYPGITLQPLMEALILIMKNNIFRFGDTYWHQKSGTAMGTPPAPPYANLYYAIHEESFLDDFQENLGTYKRFIDDVFGIWLPYADPDEDNRRWTEFKQTMNSYHGMQWEFSERVLSVDYMDLTISIRDNHIHTTIYEKALNLYLYIPPHSAHPPGVLNGLIFGCVHRFFTLCTDQSDAIDKTKEFYQRLLVRGYKADHVKPLIYKAIDKMTRTPPPSTQQPDQPTTDNPTFFHIQYHPNDPTSRDLQQLWKEHIVHPPNGYRHITKLKNFRKKSLNMERLIVCYSRPPNLGNLLSSRNLDKDNGPPVSSYL